MDLIPIAKLLPGIQSGHIRAIVMVKWPYSSSRREMAVILAEPSLRLRRANGQVKARFTNASALSLTMADITVGDEMLLSLQGAAAEWKSEDEKLERGIGLELRYTNSVALRVLRNGVEVVSQNTIVDAGMLAISQHPRPCTSEVRTIAGCQ
jgi:hypothetical protein